MFVVGTAGHVDHGKSTLVKALTGIDPDRWEEEQRRQMTIDLGFAWLTLPGGRRVSVVDVPGHERFIKNMLAGVGGLDAALLIIAADESLMPQTREHLAILDLLDVRHGVVVLTKADLVDAEWLALVREEVTSELAGTSLADAPLVAVSARTGAGLDQLRQTLEQVLQSLPPRAKADGIPRLPVDRSFTIGGFGTVVTGTLRDGSLRVGDEVVVLPSGLTGRIRGLQIHYDKVEAVAPGTRIAVNLAGIHHSEVKRGDVLVPPGTLQPTRLIDLHLRVLPDAPGPLEQNCSLDLFTGASEVPCRLTLLDTEQLAPGSSGWAQVRLEAPVVVVRDDHCILRIASPSRTVAGGMVVDPFPVRHRRFRTEVIAALETLARGDPAELVLQTLGTDPPRPWDEVARAVGLPDEQMRSLVSDLVASGRVLTIPALHIGEKAAPFADVLLVTPAGWQVLATRLVPPMRAYHTRFPLRQGMPREELRQKLRLAPRLIGGIVDEAIRCQIVAADETSVWLVGHDPQLAAHQQRAVETTLAAMRRTPYSPPLPDLDPEVLAWVVQQQMLVRIAPDLYLLPETYAELVNWVLTMLQAEGSLTVGQLRDHFGSTRRYALALLEHLDERKLTRRVGERRELA
ncbi:selenocysteine-specific translation elongation factor [Candidatus Chloroploca sp. M-50]|uniref:Selenocysteine-specific elongation factor n=1 Tax=Candidatus Chloroploca mongolica TaxID=2528176 RepID=A0ABS4D837_9CHLR|nr:selenocysteine-specific translation elongation factor [Candidatus Chloroploca mongolica]MBP1465579.1 selenocysteine-specific translation elongation factor [Candidatus Chloroploca mongolica]